MKTTPYTPTHVITVHSGFEYAALVRDGKYHFADGAGWVDPTPVPDQILSVRPMNFYNPSEAKDAGT